MPHFPCFPLGLTVAPVPGHPAMCRAQLWHASLRFSAPASGVRAVMVTPTRHVVIYIIYTIYTLSKHYLHTIYIHNIYTIFTAAAARTG